jgi:tetratricopeptide (TPR) repeat protein
VIITLLLSAPSTASISGLTPELLWGAVTAVGTLILAAIGFVSYFSAQARGQRGLIERQVQTEVKAAIGGALLDFVNFRETVQRQIQEAGTERSRLTTTYEDELKKLHEQASKTFDELMSLHGQLRSWATQVELIAAVPAVLVRNARDETRDHPDAASLSLVRLLEHKTADSDELELGGDLARMQLQDRALAMKLYERAVSVNPDNISAKAEFLALSARLYNTRQSAKEQLIDLVRSNPSNTNAFGTLMNVLTDLDDYEGMRALLLELLPDAKYKSLIWRQLAIIYQELVEPANKVTEAYETAMALAEQDGKIRFVNVARPYVGFLMRDGNLREAFRIVNRMIEYDPLEAELHITRGDIYRATNDLVNARLAYEFGQRLGFGHLEALATERISEVEILQQLAELPEPIFTESNKSAAALDSSPASAKSSP